MTRYPKFSNCGTLALLCNAKAFQAEITSGDWPEVNHHSSPLLGGVTATAGDVVLTGDLNVDLVALDGESGQVLFRGGVGGPIAVGVVTYGARYVQHA